MSPPFLTCALSHLSLLQQWSEWRSCENQHMADCKNWTAECVVSGNGTTEILWNVSVHAVQTVKKEKHFCAHKLYTSKTPTIKTLFKGNKMFFFFSFMGHWSYNKMWKYWNGLFFKINVTVVCSVYAFSLFKCVIFLFDSYSTARSVCVFSPFTLQCQVWAC